MNSPFPRKRGQTITNENVILLLQWVGSCGGAPQGSVQGGVQGGAQVPPGAPHSTAPPAGVGGIRRYALIVYQSNFIEKLSFLCELHL